MTTDDNNYAIFPPEDDVEAFAGFAQYLRVGERAPDPVLVDLESGQKIRLSGFTRRGPTVVEFGSLT
jgi:hypothetical protein